MNTKKKMAAGLAAVVGVGAAAFGLATVKPAAAQGGVPLPSVAAQHHGDGDHDRDDRNRGERHPEIRAALMNLNQAKANLQRAAHDFGGHREKALDLVQQAINQCNLALKDDKH